MRPLAEFGPWLLARGLIDEMALKRAERAGQQSGERLDLVLTRLGLIPEPVLTSALSEFLGLPLAKASEFPAAPVLGDRIPLAFLKSNRILPLALDGDRLIVATASPLDKASLDALAFELEMPVAARIAEAREVDLALERLYGETRAPDAGIGLEKEAQTGDADVRRLKDLASEAPVIRLVQDLIQRAVEAKASDIHIEPREDSLRVRFRVDGLLHTVERLSPALAPAATSRIKIMARLDIAERRLPQDGRIKSTVRGREVDLRISTMPTMGGESVVLRILDRAAVALDFASLGFGDVLRSGLERLLARPNGIILVTGPTGSGKTTTLYTALGRLDAERQKIFTIEDPIEYQLAGVNQIQVQPRIELGFAAVLRSVLRQDPDVIMVGEIRDPETARMAIQASLTGHLVLSTVHTNSAAASIARLLDMGVEDYLLATSIAAVTAQRLVRRLCGACAAPAEAPATLEDRLKRDIGEDLMAREVGEARLKRAVGCQACRGTGYQGRTVVAELLDVVPAVRHAILTSRSEHAIAEAARASGMRSMYEDGVVKALCGETTLEEVLRVTRIE